MNNPKQKKKRHSSILALLPALLIGALCGILTVFFSESYAEKHGGSSPLYMLLMLAFLCVSLYINLILHELGHLIFGLMSGYRFSSFRIGNLMLVRSEGRLRFAKLSIAGTAGQCLMAPPEPNAEGRIPTKLFNLGGALSNLFFAAVFFILCLLLPSELASAFFLIAAVIGLLTGLTNGIPMRLGMVDNDGYNAFSLEKSPHACRAFYVQLKVNAEIAAGVRLAEMPDALFTLDKDADRQNPLIAAVAVFSCNRLMDACRFTEAEEAIRVLLDDDKSGIVDLHRHLLICDLISLLIGSGRWEEAATHLTDKQKKFMQMMSAFPSVIRTEYLIARHVTKNAGDAEKKKQQFERIAKSYPYPKEIAGERELMEIFDKAEKEAAQTETKR